MKQIIFLVLIFSIFSQNSARASAGDAALTVAVGTTAGAILGASTLPFYEEPSDNTKNIFYGAAIGAVVGVLVAAYAGVEETRNGDAEDALFLPQKNQNNLSTIKRKNLTLVAQGNISKPVIYAQKKQGAFSAKPLIWAPIASFHF